MNNALFFLFDINIEIEMIIIATGRNKTNIAKNCIPDGSYQGKEVNRDVNIISDHPYANMRNS